MSLGGSQPGGCQSKRCNHNGTFGPATARRPESTRKHVLAPCLHAQPDSLLCGARYEVTRGVRNAPRRRRIVERYAARVGL